MMGVVYYSVLQPDTKHNENRLDLGQPAAVELVSTTTGYRRNSVLGAGQSITRSNKIILSTEK